MFRLRSWMGIGSLSVLLMAVSCRNGGKTSPGEEDGAKKPLIANGPSSEGKDKKKNPDQEKDQEKDVSSECQIVAEEWYDCIFEENAQPVSLPATAARMGGQEPLVTIQLFWSLFCPECSSMLRNTLPGLLAARPNDVQVQLAGLPLSAHELDVMAMEIAYELRAQKGDEAFWKFLQALHEKPEALYIQERLLAGDARKTAMENFQKKCGMPQVKPLIDLFRLCDSHPECVSFEKCVQGYYNDLQQGKPVPEVKEEKPTCAELAQRRFDCIIKDHVFDIPVEGSPQTGNADALATVVVFSDFQCPYCKKMAEGLAELSKQFGPRLRVVYKNYPLTYHVEGQLAARLGAEVFARKGDAAFFRLHDSMFANQEKLSRDWLVQEAANYGLKPEEAAGILDSTEAVPRIEADVQLGNMLQVSGTPTLFLNGVQMPAVDKDQMEKIIQQEIARVEKLFPAKDRKNVYARIAQPGRAVLLAMAQKAGLDMKKLEAARKSGVHRKTVEAERQLGMKLCRSIPCLFVNGRRVDADPLSALPRFLEEAQEALAQGVARAQLYVHLSSGKGLLRALTQDESLYDVEVFDFAKLCDKPQGAWTNWMPSFVGCAKTARNCGQYRQCVLNGVKKGPKQ